MTAYRWSRAGIDTTTACRTLRRKNAVTSWAFPGHTFYQLADCEVQLYDRTVPILLITGPSKESVHNAAERLGYHDTHDAVRTITTPPR